MSEDGDEQHSALSLSPGASLGSSSADGEAPVCRDFLRNVCKRGKRCKFRHPNSPDSSTTSSTATEVQLAMTDCNGTAAAAASGPKSVLMPQRAATVAPMSDSGGASGALGNLNFCHDFQNAGCRRPNCKFLHCTREEEEYYKQTGHLPLHLQHLVALGIGLSHAGDLPLSRGEIPVCKDHLKGGCRRGSKCKFRHVSQADFDLELLARTHGASNPLGALSVAAPPSSLPQVLSGGGSSALAIPGSGTPSVSPHAQVAAAAAAAAAAQHMRGCPIGINVGGSSVLFDSSFMIDPSNPMNAAMANMAAANCAPAAPSVNAAAAQAVTPVSGNPSEHLFELVKRRRLDFSAGLEPAPTPALGLHGVLPTPSFGPPSFAPSLAAAVGAYSFDNGLPAALAAVERPRLLGATPAHVQTSVSGPTPTVVVTTSTQGVAGGATPVGGAVEDPGLLRKKYDELRRVNADLMAANDLLLEQNAHLRNKLAGTPNMVVVTAANPAVTAHLRNPMTSVAQSAINSLAQSR